MQGIKFQKKKKQCKSRKIPLGAFHRDKPACPGTDGNDYSRAG